MIVRFLMPQTDMDSRVMVESFERDGFASLTVDGTHYGFIREVGEERGKILIVADVTEPELVQNMKERLGDEEPLEIEMDPERGEEIRERSFISERDCQVVVFRNVI